MKRDDIMNAMQDIDEKLVEQTDAARRKRERKRRVPLWIGGAAAAAALCFCAAWGISLLPQRFAELSYSRYAIAKAEYPKAARYPSVLDTNRDEKWDEWSQERRVRMEAADGVPESAGEFFSLTSQQFLSGADGENRIYSPANLYMALAMLAQSTDGEAREQVLSLMGAGSAEAAGSYAQALWNASYVDDGVAKVLLANSLWLDNGVKADRSTADTLAQTFRASVFTGDMSSSGYSRALTDWISAQTGGLINTPARFESGELQLAELVSTIYYKANWVDEFSRSKNERLTFHAAGGDVTAEFMYEYDMTGCYYFGETFGAVRKGLDHGGAMTFILPDEGKSIDDVLADGDFARFVFGGASDYDKQKTLRIHLHVPKFDVSSDLDLAQGLKELGVTSVFEGGDFSPLLPDEDEVMLAGVKHSARVSMDEQGVTAAAVVRMPLAGSAMPPEEEIELYFDRPFIFVITNDAGIPLFVGTVCTP